MTRATNTALGLFFFSALYAALFTGAIPTTQIIQNEIIPLLPFWFAVTFGAYALGSLGIDILSFNDKEDKYKELLLQIGEAKIFLKKNNVDITE